MKSDFSLEDAQFVYPVRWRGQTTFEKLRLSLRSVDRYLDRPAMLLTDRPVKLTFAQRNALPWWVSFRVAGNGTYADALLEAAKVCTAKHVVWMNDDIVWLDAKASSEVFAEVLNRRYRLPDAARKSRWSGKFKQTKKEFAKLLEERGIVCDHDYSTHRPYVYEVAKMRRLLSELLPDLHKFKKVPFEDAYYSKHKRQSEEKEAVSIEVSMPRVMDFGTFKSGHIQPWHLHTVQK